MRGTLVLLCTLLIIWIGGSSYWYLCKINDHCNHEKVDLVVNNQQDQTLHPEETERAVIEVEQEAEPVIATPLEKDSVTLAVEFIRENPSRIVFFKYAKYDVELSPEDLSYIQKLRLFLENEQVKKIYVIGHSDTSGSPEGLVYASDQRAKFIKKVMIENGIPETKIQLRILGEGFPIASNATAEGRAKNRRVEISLKNFKYHE